MYFIAFFGFLLLLFSVVMIISPEYWAKLIIKFSEMPYFHPFEILTKFVFGIVFIIFANQTLYPKLMLFIGYLLIAVSVGLLLTPPSRHKQFAVWSADKFKNYFRSFGFVSLVFGAFLVYAAVRS